ncbi:hypothetical protein H2203_005180 [Taxawa tesnikishii (nom. ined.)]|nr:hypothetical protein H2203_005180 [Dothideales sp. JES 119]
MPRPRPRPGLIINANQNAFASEFGCEFSNDDFSQFLCSPIRDFSQDITLDERVTALEKSLQLAMQIMNTQNERLMAHERKHQDNDELNLHIMKPWGKRVNNIITLALMRLFKGEV